MKDVPDLILTGVLVDPGLILTDMKMMRMTGRWRGHCNGCSQDSRTLASQWLLACLSSNSDD